MDICAAPEVGPTSIRTPPISNIIVFFFLYGNAYGLKKMKRIRLHTKIKHEIERDSLVP